MSFLRGGVAVPIHAIRIFQRERPSKFVRQRSVLALFLLKLAQMVPRDAEKKRGWGPLLFVIILGVPDQG